MYVHIFFLNCVTCFSTGLKATADRLELLGTFSDLGYGAKNADTSALADALCTIQ